MGVFGDVAQLVEHYNGIVGVRGSIPLISTASFRRQKPTKLGSFELLSLFFVLSAKADQTREFRIALAVFLGPALSWPFSFLLFKNVTSHQA